MQRLWEPGTPSLPIGNVEPDNNVIVFHGKKYGEVVAYVIDERGFIIDMIVGHSFLDAYESVIEEYPGASWENPDE